MMSSNTQYSSFENAPCMPLPMNNKHPYWNELEAIPRKIKLAEELQTMFKPVNQYYSWNHKTKIYGTSKCLDNPLNIIKNAYNMKVDTSLYQKNRNYFSNLYKSMRSADIPHSDILSIWGNPYIGTVTKWNELSYQRKQNILKDYPGTDGIANRINEAKQALTLELANADYDTKQFIQDVVIVGLSVWAEKQFKLPQTLMAPVYATRMERTLAYIQPKYEKIAYKLSDKAGKLYKKAEDFFRKKTNNGLKKATGTAEKRTIPTHDKQRELIEKKVNSGEWKRVRGRNMYEDKEGRRFAPTKEKFEIEVGEKVKGKWTHIGIIRAEGNGAGELLRQYAKGTKGGHYFK